MSAFLDLVVKLERQKLGDRAGVLPTIHTMNFRRIYVPRLIRSRLLHAGFLIWAVLSINVDFHLLESQTFLVRQTSGLTKLFATLCVLVITWASYRISRYRVADTVADLVVAAREQRARNDAINKELERQAAVKGFQEAEARRHAVTLATIEADRRSAAARKEEQRAQERSAYEWRNAVLHMESGLRQVLHDYRKRAYWVPETADEEALYEKIRLRISQANVPEFGILRRSTDGVVTMILGDRSCLPPEPPEGFLRDRTLKPVGELLGPER